VAGPTPVKGGGMEGDDRGLPAVGAGVAAVRTGSGVTALRTAAPAVTPAMDAMMRESQRTGDSITSGWTMPAMPSITE
jgi:hypothetical protein